MKNNLMIAAVLAMASSSLPGISAGFDSPRPQARRRARVKPSYSGMTEEQLAWNANVEAKRKKQKHGITTPKATP